MGVLAIKTMQRHESISHTDNHAFLIERVALDRDQKSFISLFEHFAPRIKAMMLKSGADEALADDLVQDVMMKIWRKADQFVGRKGSAAAWVFTIARNARIDKLRRKNAQPYKDIDDIEIAGDQEDVEELTARREYAERIHQALEQLPEEQREIVRLAYIADVPHTAIAQKLNLPLGTVKSRMRLAYGKLRTRLEDLR